MVQLHRHGLQAALAMFREKSAKSSEMMNGKPKALETQEESEEREKMKDDLGELDN
ncbi:MAG: hypothetical protein JWQ21_1102 [Herminiimonas sp.]|jgi:hypothetical protein|nr:hypothetical protein [Herminiimonas sp.]